MEIYIKATESGFYILHSDQSFEPICGYMTEKRDAIRAKEILTMTLSGVDSIYHNRQAIADRIASLRWDCRELTGHPETRARAFALRELINLAESRLLAVTRP